MTQALFSDIGWSGAAGRLPAGFDLAATALEHGAFVRARGVRSAADLLRLALIYGATPLSLRSTAAWAEATGLAALSDVSLLERLQRAGDWLAAIVEALLSAAIPPVAAGSGGARRVRLVDATTTCAPGPRSGQWRLHADYALGRSRFGGFKLTDQHEAESLKHFAPAPGDIFVADRFYAKARQLHHAVAGGADFVVRRGLTSCRLLHADGAKFELARTLAAVGCRQTLDIPVLVPLPADTGGAPTAETGTVSPVRARLIIRHLGQEAAVAARRRASRKAAKQGQKATAKRLQAAEYIMLLTSLDAAEFSADQVLDLYRLRWQIEIAFKRLKSVLGFADLAAKDPQLVRACLYAKLIVALLCEDILQDLLDSPPSAPRYVAAVPLASLASRSRSAPDRHLRSTRFGRLRRTSPPHHTQHRRAAKTTM
jgi:hypothetical protein